MQKRILQPRVSTRLKVSELRDICTGMGIDSSGRKADLLRRINELSYPSNDRVNDHANTHQAISNATPENLTPIPTTDQVEYRSFREEQDREYLESLRMDKIKAVQKSIDNRNFDNIDVSDIKVFLESKDISYANASNKPEFVSLIPSITDEDEPGDIAYEEVRLNREQLRQARLNFYKSDISNLNT